MRVVHAIAKTLRATPDVFYLQFVLFEKADRLGIEEGEVCARKQDGHVAKKPLVEHLRLRKVGDFGGSAEVSSGGEQIVLHDGTKQRIGAKEFWMGIDAVKPFFAGGHARTAGEGSVRGGDYLALPFLHRKKKGAARGDVHLRLIAGPVELLAAAQQQFVQFIALRESGGKNGSGDAVKLFVEGVEKDEAIIGEDVGEEPGAGTAIACHGTIALVQDPGEARAVGACEPDGRFANKIVDLVTQANAAHRPGVFCRLG